MRVLKPTSPRNKNYNLFLCKLFLASCANRAALLSGDICNAQFYRMMEKAERYGHIRQDTYREKYGPRYASQPYYMLTAEGLEYLSKVEDPKWCMGLPKEVNRLVLSRDRRNESTIVKVRYGNSIIFALNMGASVVLESIDDTEVIITDDDMEMTTETDTVDDSDASKRKTTYLNETVKEFLKNNYLQGLNHPSTPTSTEIKILQGENDKTSLHFFSSPTIKANLLNQDEKTAQNIDISFAKYTGILVGDKMSVIVFHASHDGISWMTANEPRYIRTARQFSRYCSPVNNIGIDNVQGAILIYNEKNFSDIVTDKFKKQRGPIGESFAGMYLIPHNANGSTLLRWIMDNSVESRNMYIDECINDYSLTQNKKEGGRIFRYRDKDDNAVFDGSDMNVKVLQLVQSQKQKFPDRKYGGVCFSWQVPYYKRLWPDLKMYVID